MPTELLMEEKLVLNVIQEYLNKNRYFNMKEILPFIQARFKMASININLRGIEEALRMLARNKLIVEGSKLMRKDILNNKKRKKIYNFIIENPGIYLNRVTRELKISYHVVVWHVSMLLKFNYIKKESLENHEVYFEAKFNLKNSKFKYLTSKEKSKIIIEYLRANDIGISKTRISIDLKMHINTTSKYLDSLEEFKVIVKKKFSNEILYFLNEDFIEN